MQLKSNPVQVTADTPTEGLSRTQMLVLAQKVFANSSMKCSNAFSQFRINDHLADLIDAKREGVFDYGACLVETDEGVQYPSCDAAISSLKKAKEGTLSEEDMASLGLDEEQFPKVVMNKRAQPKKAQPKQIEQQGEAAPESGGEEEEEAAPAPIETTRRRRTVAPEPEKVSAPASSNKEVLKAIDEFKSNLADILERQGAAIGGLTAGLIGVAELLGLVTDAVNNIHQLQDPGAEIVTIPDEVCKNLIRLGVKFSDGGPQEAPEPEGEKGDGDEEEQDTSALIEQLEELGYSKDQIRRIDEKAAIKVVENQWAADNVSVLKDGSVKLIERDNDGDGGNGKPTQSASYTQEELEKMTIEELRKIGSMMGIAKADKASYKTSIIKKIVSMSESQ